MHAEGELAFDRLLGSLYDSVLAPDGFQAFIVEMARQFRLKSVCLVVRDLTERDTTGLWLHGLESQWLESYVMTYGREDLLALHLEQAPIGHFYASNVHLPEPERFVESRFFREWAVPQGVAFAAGCVVMREGSWLTQVIFQRSSNQGAFTLEELAEFDRLVPHWQRVAQMRHRLVELRAGQDLLAASLDTFAMPTLLFDELGRIAHQNRGAQALLDAGVSLSRRDDRLVGATPASTRSISLEVSHAMRAHRDGLERAPGIVLVERAGRLPLTLMTLPLRGQGEHAVRGGALMFVFDPEITPVITADLVRRLFDLSAAESELAVALCSGQSPEEVAADRGRALSTVRSQIRSLFAKTGTNRQADLVGLLLASPAYFVAQQA